VKSNAAERRCQGKNKQGVACRATVVNAAGYCVAHDPERPTDYRALGRASARARARPNPDRVHPSLREFLRREVPPSEVWAALKLALEGGSESARVSAARVLIDALHTEQEDRSMELQIKTAAEEFHRKMAERVERIRVIDAARRTAALEPLGLAELADKQDDEFVAELARRLAAIPEHVRSEFAS
jgi:hypothetical protein